MAQINSPINFNVVDTPLLDQTNFGPDMKRWLTTLIDILNTNFNLLTEAFTNIIAVGAIDIGGSGAGPITVSVTGLIPSDFVNVSLISTTNPGITITNVTAGTNDFMITFSGDPGTSAMIVYQAFTNQPQ